MGEGSKVEAGKVPGKIARYDVSDGVEPMWVGFAKWTQYLASEADIADWLAEEKYGGGICFQTRHHPALDIDVDDSDPQAADIADQIASEALRILGAAPARCRDGSSRLLMPFRLKDGCAPPAKARLIFKVGDHQHVVELLGHGNQFVAEGVHPKGGRYGWRDGRDLATVGHDGLTAVTVGQLKAFFSELPSLLELLYGAEIVKLPDVRVRELDADKASTAPAKPVDEFKPEELHYAVARFGALVKAVENAAPGTRRDVLRDASFELGHYVGQQLLDAGLVESTLYGAAYVTGLGVEEINATIRDGLKDGAKKPFELSERELSRWRESDPMAFDVLDGEGQDAAEAPIGETTTERGMIIPQQESQKSIPDRRPFRMSAMAGKEPEARHWRVPQWISDGTVTSLYGSGGVGKSLLAQQLGAAVAAGRDWIGLPTVRGAVLMYACEDSNDELHRRQININRVVGCGFDDLGDFIAQGRDGDENLMIRFDRDGNAMATEFLERVEKTVAKYDIKLLILDNVAQIFGGNENDRIQVTAFVGRLQRLARDRSMSILLLGHRNKAGAGYSGSTAWDAAVRSRIEFGVMPTDDEDGTLQTDERIMRLAKSNYSKSGTELRMRYHEGAFLDVLAAMDVPPSADGTARATELENDCGAFLVTLEQARDEGRAVSHSKSAREGYGPRAFSKVTGIPQKRLERAMEALFKRGAIMANMKIGKTSCRHPLKGIGRPGWEIKSD